MSVVRRRAIPHLEGVAVLLNVLIEHLFGILHHLDGAEGYVLLFKVAL